MGNDSQQQLFMKAMNSAHGKLQSMVAKHLKTRTCPMLRFHLDQSIKKSMQTLQLIEKSMADIAERESANNSSDSEDSNSDKNHS
jgi:ribosome-binding factor A